MVCTTSKDPFLIGVNCCAEVFLEVQDVALSGVNIDPKAVTVYPTTRVYGGVAVQKEFLTGKPLAGKMRLVGLDFAFACLANSAFEHKLLHAGFLSIPAWVPEVHYLEHGRRSPRPLQWPRV